MPSRNILRDARNAPPKRTIEEHQEAIGELRKKNYTWREIASFLTERGVQTDHTAVYRLFTKSKMKSPHTFNSKEIMIPTAQQYRDALSVLAIAEDQRKMLEAHYRAPNRSITYTELSAAAKPDAQDQDYANLRYGKLGRSLGEALDFTFAEPEERPGERFYSSALGMPDAYPRGKEFQLVMHHTLADAIRTLNWFPE